MITKRFGGSLKPYVFESVLVSRYQARLPVTQLLLILGLLIL